MLAVQSRDDQIVQMQAALQDLREVVNGAALITAMISSADQIMSDQARMSRFWHSGYEAFANHAGDGASRFLARRMITATVTAVIAGTIWVGVKLGVFK